MSGHNVVLGTGKIQISSTIPITYTRRISASPAISLCVLNSVMPQEVGGGPSGPNTKGQLVMPVEHVAVLGEGFPEGIIGGRKGSR